MQRAGQVLQGIVLAATAALQQEDLFIPLPLVETAVVLHGA